MIHIGSDLVIRADEILRMARIKNTVQIMVNSMETAVTVTCTSDDEAREVFHAAVAQLENNK